MAGTELYKVVIDWRLPESLQATFDAMKAAAYRGDETAAKAAFDMLEEAGVEFVQYDWIENIPLQTARQWVLSE